MRLSRTIIIPIAVASIWLTYACPAQASVVTIDAAANTAKSDDSTLEPFGLQVSGQQVGICLKNKVLHPQAFTLKVQGLSDAKYDLYVNGFFKGSKALKQVTGGLSFRVDGSVADPAMMKCLNAVNPGLQANYDLLSPSKNPEARLACDTLGQAVLWVKLPLAQEEAWRSVRIILAPASRPLQLMEWVKRVSAEDTVGSISNACWLLQQGRHRMSIQIKDEDLRNRVVGALTPISLSVNYAARMGKPPHIYVKLLNNCNLPVSGAISLDLPAGWKAGAKTLKFSQLKSGKAFVVNCDLIPPSSTAAVPDSVAATASLFLVQLDQPSSYKLTATAQAITK